MLRLFITTRPNFERDYSRYVMWDTVSIASPLCAPRQLKFTFYNLDQSFEAPFQRCYVRLWSDLDGKTLFTGYVAATPDQNFVTAGPLAQHFKYDLTCTSDEYLLNFKYVPYIPAFINQTQGQILAQLAEILMPGWYDTGLIQPGFLVPYFTYDPTKTWSSIAKSFGDAARFYYVCKDRKIVYAPYGDYPLGIHYDETERPIRWNSQKLSTTVLQVPTVNDVTVIGDTESGSSHDDYFIGNGFTGEFPLHYGTFQSRTAVLLQDDLTQNQVNTQNWTLNDSQFNLDFSAGALNVVSPLFGPALTGELIANNGVELAGGLECQHGEFQWNDASVGEVGGLYLDASVLESLCAFNISSSGAVNLTSSGAGGVFMQPSLSGQLIGPKIVSRPNHHYVLKTKIACPAETRFQQVFATKDGQYFGGQQQHEYGSITYSIEDVDIGATYNQSLTGIFNDPVSHTTVFTVTGVSLPAYAAYALIKNQRLNLTANYCLLSKTPAGSLSIAGSLSGAFAPTGAILPFLGPEAEYAGAITPSLSSQIVLSSGVTGGLAPPLPLLGFHNHTLGFGLDQQDASVVQSSGNNLDTLGFYLTTTPAAGARIKFRSNEAQRAISRVIDSKDIAFEAALVGDDGHRAAAVSNMSPLPRTSEDCDSAAQAYIYDHEKIFYNGSYVAESDLFLQDQRDFPYYPVAGRFINVHCPARNLDHTNFLVTTVTTTVLSAADELLTHNIQFGADTRTEKVLAEFTPSQPSNIFTEQDNSNQPTPQTLALMTTGTYMADIEDTDAPFIIDKNVWLTINSPYLSGAGPADFVITPESFQLSTDFVPVVASVPLRNLLRGRPVSSTISLPEAPLIQSPSGPVKRIGPQYAFPTTPSVDITPGTVCVEIRMSDQSWGLNAANLVARYTVNAFTLPKNNYDQTWYMRLVQFSATGTVAMLSRRSKIVRVQYPFRPTPPNVVYATTFDMQLDFTGDQRNIYGVEVRLGNDDTIIFQQAANSTQDLYFNFQQIFNALVALFNAELLAASQFVTVPATAMPWSDPAFPFGIGDGTPPVSVEVTAGSLITIGATGMVGVASNLPPNDASGVPGTSGATTGSTGELFPSAYNPFNTVGLGGLVGAFANGSGQVLKVINIGVNNSVMVPPGASQLLLGISDDVFADNNGSFYVGVEPDWTTPVAMDPVTTYVPGTALPWPLANGQNPTYNFGASGGTSPIILPVCPVSSIVTLAATGLVNLGNGITTGPEGTSDLGGASPFIEMNANAYGYAKGFHSTPLNPLNKGAMWSNFSNVTHMPADAVVQNIYPVIVVTVTSPGAITTIRYGNDGQPTWSYGHSYGVLFPGFVGGVDGPKYDHQMFVDTTNIDLANMTNVADLSGWYIGGAVQSTISASFFADLYIEAVGFAIYYTSASPEINKSMDSPVPVPDGQGLAWALPTVASWGDEAGNGVSHAFVGGGGGGGLIGAFTDSSGNILETLAIGTGGTFTTPDGATQMTLGINDTSLGDNSGGFVVTQECPPVTPFDPRRGFTARFFNAQWLYSPPTKIFIPPPAAPVLEIGVRFSQLLQINSDIQDRDDIVSQTCEVSADNNFDSILFSSRSTGQPGSFQFTVPSTGALWARSKRSDLIGDGAWSNVLVIPRGDLIASDYLATQGSVPPVVTTHAASLFSYVASSSQIIIVSADFTVVFPNGATNTVPSTSGVFTSYDDGTGVNFPLAPGTTYAYIPYLENAISPDASIHFGKLYTAAPANLAQTLISDGVTLMTSSALFVTSGVDDTAGAGQTSTGGAQGGTYTGFTDGCSELAELILMADGRPLPGRDIMPGHIVMAPHGKTSTVGAVRLIENVLLYKLTTETGRSVRVSESHAFKVNRYWASTREIMDGLVQGEIMYAQTLKGPERIISVLPDGIGSIVGLQMKWKSRVYYVAGFESHNMMYKTEIPAGMLL